MTSANVPIISLETSHTSSRSSSSNHQDDKISFKMMDELQSICSGNAHSPCRPRNSHLHGRQSFPLGSSSRTDESILSWSLVRRPIPTPYQHVGNNGHSFRTDKSLEIYSPFLCHDIHQQHDSGLIYQQEAHGPRVAHLSDIATADMQMLCNIFPILSSQLMKRSSFKQFFILKKKIYGMPVN